MNKYEAGRSVGSSTEDLDCSAKTSCIARALAEGGTLDTPKSGHGRTVDLSQSLTDRLAAHKMTREQDTLKYGWADLPPWLFVTKAGTPRDAAHVEGGNAPLPFTRHGLRHSYASILSAEAVSPVYVPEQLGTRRLN
ncbi:MAG: hypothetical protein KGS09_15765 [Nitrospirae bacterium]|nr:hypothetical protein [Nitrospirota bacterium]MDE3042988.1 hypothetical protein [Nitrospirota bacterium]MDE3218772.1 hypothetical protein [Nitrospirota bacterium]